VLLETLSFKKAKETAAQLTQTRFRMQSFKGLPARPKLVAPPDVVVVALTVVAVACNVGGG
jgi:hypothetical protein